jgi:hypothetical protein
MRTAVCSIISPNYRHFARVLMASLRVHHPEWDRYVLVVGGDAGNIGDEPFETLALDALGLPDITELTFRYTVLELDTAMKPWLIEHLFSRNYDRVIYLDPDVAVYSRLEELDRDRSFVTLTPHLIAPVDDPPYLRERSILVAGTWNLGFIAITRDPQLDALLGWWKGRLKHDCVVEPENGLFVDQKWIDLVPGLFDRVASLRHDGYNVAYWNLRQRRVTRDDAGTFHVNGHPLRFMHFSGFNPLTPQFVSRHDPSLMVAAWGDAALVFDAYAAALRAAGLESFRHAPYAFAEFADGTRILDEARIAYRRSRHLQNEAAGNPFARPDLFRSVPERKPPLAARAAYRAYRILTRARPIVRLFPRSLRDALRIRLVGDGASPPRNVARPMDLEPGVAIAGYFSRDTGVGESARRCAASCAAAGIVTQIIDVDGGAELTHRAGRRRQPPRHPAPRCVQDRRMALGACRLSRGVGFVGGFPERDLGAERLHRRRRRRERHDSRLAHAARGGGHGAHAVLAVDARRAGGTFRVPPHVRLRQLRRTEESTRGDRGVPPRVSSR